MALPETIQQLCQVLARIPLTAIEVATSLGEILEDEGPDGDIIVQPAEPAIKAAVVVREIDSEEPDFVELEMAKKGRIRLSALREAFGPYSELPPLHEDSPAKVAFYVKSPETSVTCAIVADVTAKGRNLEKGKIVTVMIRRDVGWE